MKLLKLLFAAGIAVGAIAASIALAAEPTFQSMANPAAMHPALYSFADVYRLTVAGAPASFALESSEAAVRVAVAQPGAAAELRFLVSSVPQPDKWLLLLAGVALAGWVAHRRLVHTL